MITKNLIAFLFLISLSYILSTKADIKGIKASKEIHDANTLAKVLHEFTSEKISAGERKEYTFNENKKLNKYEWTSIQVPANVKAVIRVLSKSIDFDLCPIGIVTESVSGCLTQDSFVVSSDFDFAVNKAKLISTLNLLIETEADEWEQTVLNEYFIQQSMGTIKDLRVTDEPTVLRISATGDDKWYSVTSDSDYPISMELDSVSENTLSMAPIIIINMDNNATKLQSMNYTSESMFNFKIIGKKVKSDLAITFKLLRADLNENKFKFDVDEIVNDYQWHLNESRVLPLNLSEDIGPLVFANTQEGWIWFISSHFQGKVKFELSSDLNWEACPVVLVKDMNKKDVTCMIEKRSTEDVDGELGLGVNTNYVQNQFEMRLRGVRSAEDADEIIKKVLTTVGQESTMSTQENNSDVVPTTKSIVSIIPLNTTTLSEDISRMPNSKINVEVPQNTTVANETLSELSNGTDIVVKNTTVNETRTETSTTTISATSTVLSTKTTTMISVDEKISANFEDFYNGFILAKAQKKVSEIYVSKNKTVKLEFTVASAEKRETQWYSFNSLDNTEIEVIIESESIKWSQCAFAHVDETDTFCINTTKLVFPINFNLRVNRSALSNNTSLILRSIISGCDKLSKTRVISSTMVTFPNIVHNEIGKCEMYIDIPEMQMLSLRITKIDSNSRKCSSSVTIYGRMNENRKSTNDKVVEICGESATHDFIFVRNKYALIEISNTIASPIEIAIEYVPVCGDTFYMNDDTVSFPLASLGLMSTRLDSACTWTFIKPRYHQHRYAFKVDLLEHEKNGGENSSTVTLIDSNNSSRKHSALTKLNVASKDNSVESSSLMVDNQEITIQFWRMLPRDQPVDQFKLQIVTILIKSYHFVYEKPSGFLTSLSYPLHYPDNTEVNYEIRAPQGYQINLQIEFFNTGDDDKLEIMLNKGRANPKLSGLVSQKIKYQTFNNFLSLKFSANEKMLDTSLSVKDVGFKFRYTTTPICNYTYTDPNGLLSFNSTLTRNHEPTLFCNNIIMARNVYERILLYPISWRASIDDRSATCDNKNSLTIVNSYVKKPLVSNTEASITHCRNNSLVNPLVSTERALQLRTSIREQHAASISFEMGYVAFKNEYHSLKDEFKVDFSQSISSDANSYSTNLIEYVIEVPSDYYVVPRISACSVNLLNGIVLMKAENSIESFEINNRLCANQTFMAPMQMSNKIVIQLIDIPINELRDSVKFTVSYDSYLKVLREKQGSFSTLNSTSLVLSRNQNISYEWLLNIDSSYHIKLNINNITNCQLASEFYIKDEKEERIIYGKQQLCENFAENRNTYYMPSNRITIVLTYIRSVKQAVDSAAVPFFSCDYNTELRILSEPGEIKIGKSHQLKKREWIIQAPVEHMVVLRIIKNNDKFTNSQLRFSYLGTGYSENGIYHYNLKESANEKISDLVVSKANVMKVEFFSNDYDGELELKFEFHVNVFTPLQPSGLITQYRGLLTNVAKITDQNWIVKAPYGKRIEFLVSKIDLIDEEPCSAAKVEISEGNGALIRTLCGKSLDKMRFDTATNEANIRFSTQNHPGAVMDDNNKPYEGFKIFYSFIEEPGDCYFHRKSNILCNYAVSGNYSWVVAQSVDSDRDYSNEFCHGCHAEVSTDLPGTGRLLSPLIQPSKKSIKFMYRVTNGKLTLSLLPVNQRDSPIPVPLNLIDDGSWLHAHARLSQKLPFRLLFEFQRSKDAHANISSDVAIDYIQLFNDDVTCSDRDWYYSYECMSQLEDVTCLKSFDACDQNPCLNNGTCINRKEGDLKMSYSCICPLGFTGANCDSRLDWCSTGNNCSTGSKCVNRLSNYTCECDADHFGVFCQNEFNPCKTLRNACNSVFGNGVCVDGFGEGNYTCNCDAQYTGKDCETRLSTNCLANNCNEFDANAKCFDTQDDYVCTCSPGFYGKSCLNIDDCANVTCQNGGTCIDGINSFTCKCPSEFTGALCESAKVCGLCHPNNTLTCDNKAKKCQCLFGYTGQFCENKIDSCSPNPCVNGKCVNKPNGFECECNKGFKGSICQFEKNVCDSKPCSNGATCELNGTKGDFICRCLPGFEGPDCDRPIKYCMSSPCKNGAKCYEELGGFSCECRDDYTGPTCDKKKNNCDNALCEYDATCIDLIGGYECTCAPGKFGRYCNYTQDFCYDNICKHGKCIPGDHHGRKYYCECLPGFVGDDCDQEIDECSFSTCKNNGTCYDLIDAHVCLCPVGYSGRGCEQKVGYCSLQKCVFDNTLNCVEFDGGYKCLCKPGFTGTNCESIIHPCDLNQPCHSGNCVKLSNDSYKCVGCTPGYTGVNCNELIDYCASSPCKYNATCYPKLNGYYCSCKSKYSGPNCEKDEKNICHENKCMNNAKCVPSVDHANGYKCICDDKHSGVFCDKLKDPCDNVNCNNYGYCVNGKCVCDPKWPFCDKDAKCRQTKCQNQGTCIEVIKHNDTEAKCICPPGLTGKFCEQSLYCSNPMVCGNTNLCKTVGSSYQCDCVEPYIGHKCNKVVSEYMKLYEVQLKAEKQVKDKNECRFGHSKSSQMFLAIVGAGLFVFTIVGLLIGHCTISSYEKKIKKNRSYLEGSLSPSGSSVISSSYLLPRDTVVNYERDRAMTDFNIPRPQIRL